MTARQTKIEAKPTTPADPVFDAARAALDASGGDLAVAAEKMEAKVRSSPKLREALTAPLIRTACYDAVRQIMRTRRSTVWNAATVAHHTKADTSDALPPAVRVQNANQRVVLLAAETLLMFPLPGGKLLREATRSELLDAAEFYGRQSRDMGRKEAWLRLVAQHVPENKKAGDVLTGARLADLQREVSQDA